MRSLGLQNYGSILLHLTTSERKMLYKRKAQGRNIPMQTPAQKGLKKGDKSSDVTLLQGYLRRFGYIDSNQDDLLADEKANNNYASSISLRPQQFDDTIDVALRRLQQFYRLPTTGILDEKTIDLMSQPRCGNPDIRISEKLDMFFEGNPKWQAFNLSYQIENYTLALSKEVVNSAIAYAYNQWSSVVPFKFTSTGSSDANIKLSFQRRNHHMNGSEYCPRVFDGPKGEVAHAFPPQTGVVHFDDDEGWTDNPSPPSTQKDLYAAALHETGHTLGLNHSPDPDAVMYARHTDGRRRLYSEDIQNIRQLYGVTG
jgi:hypothetical protein